MMDGVEKIRIVLSGPESSGKSTLAAELATHFSMPMAPEYARFHLETGKPYPQTLDELTELARQHLAWQREHVPADAPCGIFDTDMLNFLIWADVAFGRVPEEIEQGFAAEAHHIHLLCEPDLPWQPDPLREFPNLENRRMLFDRYRNELEMRGIRYFIIRGEGAMRFAVAADCIREAQS
jgi:nicotinamide riboside kinase